jgi:hypothetical protein
MLISDISYLETVSDKNIEGSGSASFVSEKFLSVLAQSAANAISIEALSLVAETGIKAVTYNSFTTAVGLT